LNYKIQKKEQKTLVFYSFFNTNLKRLFQCPLFYTPKYITKYIVENTVGTLCKNKKIELKIEEADYHPLQKKKALKILLDNLNTYRNWLLKITIIDPACGSGAFLNQALEFLIAEHKFISELEANITGSSIVFDVENSILENNLFGVDINEESVEIAKLSLWLRTARKGRKLNSLNNNIKCGNSLIDDEAVAGDKAFIWEKEFPQVFGEYIEPIVIDTKKVGINRDNTENETKPYTFTPYKESETSSYPAEKITNYDDGIINTDLNIVNEPEVEYVTAKKIGRGFDVVIGNPPYVNAKGENFTASQKEYYYEHYKTAIYQIDTYLLFIEAANKLLKFNGIASYIIPNAWMNNLLLAGVRKYVLENFQLVEIVNTPIGVFAEATVDTVIFNISKNNIRNEEVMISEAKNNEIVFLQNTNQDIFYKNDKHLIDIFTNDCTRTLLVKIEVETISLETITDMSSGIKEYETGKGIPKQTTNDKIENRFNSNYKKNVTYLPHLTGSEISNYLIKWNDEYLSYGEWLGAPRKKEYFEGERLIIREIPAKDRLIVAYTNQIYTIKNSAHICKKLDDRYDLKYLLAILNSRLMGYYFSFKFAEFDDVFPKAKIGQCKKLPIKNINTNSQQPFIEKANLMLSKNAALQEATKAFIKLLLAKFETINVNTKLEKWYNLSFADFSKELSKQKIKLSLAQESEWLSFFEQEKQKALTIKNEIDATYLAIDKMVYALYGLSEEEVRIVEGN
jgi:hypothetical protein